MRLLFVCAGNTCRSPMAAAIAKHYAERIGADVTTDSAGLYAGGKTSGYAVAALLEKGIRLAQCDAKQIDEEIVACADAVFTMTDEQRGILEKTFGKNAKFRSLAEFAGEDIKDPYGGGLAAYREVADMLCRIMPILFENLQKRV